MSGNSCLIAVLTLKDIKRVVRINCHFHQEEFMPFKRNGNWYAGYFFINEVDLSKFVCLRWIFTCLDASRGVIRYIDAIIYLISRISEHTCDILNVFFWMKKRYLRSSARPSVAWHWMSRESSPGTYGSNWWRVPSALTVYTFQDDPHYSDSPDDKTDSLKKTNRPDGTAPRRTGHTCTPQKHATGESIPSPLYHRRRLAQLAPRPRAFYRQRFIENSETDHLS